MRGRLRTRNPHKRETVTGRKTSIILPATHPPSFHRFSIFRLLDKGFRSAQANELPTIVCVRESQLCFYGMGPMLRPAVRVIPLKRLRGCCFRSECIQECFQNSLS